MFVQQVEGTHLATGALFLFAFCLFYGPPQCFLNGRAGRGLIESAFRPGKQVWIDLYGSAFRHMYILARVYVQINR